MCPFLNTLRILMCFIVVITISTKTLGSGENGDPLSMKKKMKKSIDWVKLKTISLITYIDKTSRNLISIS